MRRAHCLTLGLATVALATGLAGASIAQTAPTTGPPRYLNWAGRGDVAAVPVAVAAQPGATQRRPNRVIPHGGAAPVIAPAPTAPRRTLTPANAWLHPAPAPVPTAAPPAHVPVAAPPAPVRPASPPPARTVPDFLPEQGGRGQPVPADIALAAPQPAAPAAADPMAPRRDAPIFRMQQPAPAAQPASAEPEQAARRYSVHRLNGQEPDTLTMPAPTMVDVATVNLDQTIASQDLAQPAPAPNLIRDAQGRVRAQPAAPEGDYQ